MNIVKGKGFIKVTRVYTLKDSEEVKTQPTVVAIDTIESYRPRNKIEGNRCTIVLKSGKYLNVTEKFSEVTNLLNKA